MSCTSCTDHAVPVLAPFAPGVGDFRADLIAASDLIGDKVKGYAEREIKSAVQKAVIIAGSVGLAVGAALGIAGTLIAVNKPKTTSTRKSKEKP